MTFSAQQILILKAYGWSQSTTAESNKYHRGLEWVSISGNIVNWSGHCKTYNPSSEDFEKWAMQKPIYYDSAIKAKMVADILLQNTFENKELRRTS